MCEVQLDWRVEENVLPTDVFACYDAQAWQMPSV